MVNFHDGRRHFGKLSKCHEMGNYRVMLMKFGYRLRKTCRVQKSQKREYNAIFQDGRRRHVENSSKCFKMGIYDRILMKIGTQT